MHRNGVMFRASFQGFISIIEGTRKTCNKVVVNTHGIRTGVHTSDIFVSHRRRNLSEHAKSSFPDM